MNTNLQLFGNDFPTATADLTRVLGVDFDESPTSFFRFVGQHRNESSPRHIVRSFVQEVLDSIGHHSFDVQIFDTDDPEPIDQSTTHLMGKISSSVLDLVPDFDFRFGLFRSSFRTFWGSKKLPVQFRQSFLVSLEKTRVLDDFTIGQRGVLLDSHVDSDGFVVDRSDEHVLSLDVETSEPVAVGIMFDRESLDGSEDVSVSLDPDVSDAGDSERAITDESETASRVFESEALHSLFGLESGITRIATILATTPEVFESELHPFTDLLDGVTVNGSDDLVVVSPVLDHLGCVVVSEGGAVVVVGITTNLEA